MGRKSDLLTQLRLAYHFQGYTAAGIREKMKGMGYKTVKVLEPIVAMEQSYARCVLEERRAKKKGGSHG